MAGIIKTPGARQHGKSLRAALVLKASEEFASDKYMLDAVLSMLDRISDDELARMSFDKSRDAFMKGIEKGLKSSEGTRVPSKPPPEEWTPAGDLPRNPVLELDNCPVCGCKAELRRGRICCGDGCIELSSRLGVAHWNRLVLQDRPTATMICIFCAGQVRRVVGWREDYPNVGCSRGCFVCCGPETYAQICLLDDEMPFPATERFF